MGRPVSPHPMEFFADKRPAAGDRRAGLRLGALELEIDGLSASSERALREHYAPYSIAGAVAEDALRIRLGIENASYFIDPPPGIEYVRVLIACDGPRVRYMSYRVAGWFDTRGGEGELLLAAGDYEPEQRAMENYIRAAVAWQAIARGGALVHAASAVWGGGAYLFYGESGAGKSTLSECNRRARVVSDDLSLVLPGKDGGLELVGSPFRGTYEGGAPVVGSFPVKACFRLIQAPTAEVRQVTRVRALAELIGNLPFVAEAFGDRPDLLQRAEQAFVRLPLAHLLFRKDDTYWDAIAAAGYGPDT